MSNSSAPEVYSPISNDDVGISSTGFIAQDISTVLPGAITRYDTGMLTTGNITISNGGGSNGGSYYYHTGSTMTISSNGNVGIGTISGSGSGGGAMGGTYTIGNVNASTFSWGTQEFVDCMPDFNKIEKMCKEYPGLAIAFEKFKTTYKLVKDHYDTPEDQRPKP